MSACAYIPLRDRFGQTKRYARISVADVPRICEHRWFLSSHGYAKTKMDGKDVYLHRFLLDLEAGNPLRGDHINGDTLDNRRENLRAITQAENLQNVIGTKRTNGSSQYRNVSWCARRKKWVVYASVDGHRTLVGSFEDEHEAGRAASRWRAENMPGSREALGKEAA